MKSILRLSFAFIGLITSLPSCVKVETSPYLSVVGPTGIELSAEGSSGTITFTANRDWTISWSDSWISISPASGQASDEPVTITASCGMNTTYEDRNATATIKMGEMTQTINIRQLANLGIVLPSQSYDLLSDSRTIEIEVQANVLYSVSSSVDWIQQTGTKALSSKTLVFSIKENTSYDAREGKITLKPQDNSVQEKIIIVRQAQKNALNVNRTSFDMPYGGGEFEIGVETNVPFDVKTNEDWIHYTKTKALSNTTVVMTVDENPTSSPRSGKVEIVQQNGTLARTINVTQAGRIAVTSIELDETSLTLKVGDTKTLVATVTPENASDKAITWTSSNPDVASVDESGTITAIEKGTATITAKAGDKSASCNVTIMREIPVSSVELDAKTLSLVAGDQVTLTAIISPEDATDKTVTWSSSDSNIASVDSDGKVTAISKGNTVITATSGSKFARCRVYVKAKHYDVPSGGVDLGLSVIWGEKNIGASSASTVGGYYLWGDPTGNGTIVYFNAPNLNSIAGTQYDIATSKMGSGWRLPTRAEIEELFSACSRTFTAINNVGGSRFTGPNGNSIYIPLSGMGFPSDGAVGNYSITSRDKGYIMSGESYKDGNDRFAYVYYFEGISYNWVSYNAPLAKFPVRPVYEKLTDDVPVTSVSLNKTSLSLKVGETETLSVIIRPSNATDKTVIWTTSDSEVATVDSNGNVTAKMAGYATISATAGGRQATCKVDVGENVVSVTSIFLDKTSIALKVGQSETLTATVKPDNATDKTVAWSSSNTEIASVDSNGKVTAISSGTATITAKAGEKSTTCSIVVSENVIPVTAITLNKTTLPLQVGQSETLVATVTPNNVTDKTVTWTSADSTIAAVNSNGKVTAKKAGSTSIVASAGGRTATCVVEVTEATIAVTEVILNKTTLPLKVGESETLIATVKPDNATDKTVKWSSSDTEIATVDNNGKVTAIKAGATTITAKAGEKSAKCSVEVSENVIPVAVVSLNKSSLSLKVGETETLIATVDPNNATDKTVTWTSSNVESATVDNNGKVTAINEGSATITAEAGSMSASCNVLVSSPEQIENIVFADINLKQRLVDKFDTNNDGELSYEEAAAVTDFTNAVTIKTITSFDEFQYFTGLREIPNNCFYYWAQLASIILPPSITSIGPHAFVGCSGLSSIVIPEGVKTIGAYAFASAGLTTLNIPNSVTEIGNYAFAGTRITTLSLPNSIDVYENAFVNCRYLETVTIPAGVTTLDGTFAGCSSLHSVSLTDGLKTIVGAFSSCISLKSITIPNSVTSIGECTFKGSGITSLSIPDSVTSIGKEAFMNCTSLSSIDLSNSIQSIAKSAFSGCTQLRSISLPKSLSRIDPYLFSGCTNLSTVFIPESVTSISEYAFMECEGLRLLDIPESVSYLGSYVFLNCTNLVSVTIPESIASIWGAFSGCSSLSIITLPSSVTYIGKESFFGCTGLTEITIPNSVKKIGESSFKGCTKLKSITIPKSVTSIGECAFESCLTLTSITMLSTDVPSGAWHMFLETNYCPIYVPASALDSYKTAQFWSEYANRIQAIPGSETIAYVNLGLSVKWATCNVGATKPEEYGGYYAWGETRTKYDYSWSTYKWFDNSARKLTKYNTQKGPDRVVDNKTVLDPEDDAAHVILGGNWRTPTKTEWEELYSKCTWKGTSLNGIRGFLVTSKINGNSIFLPAAGYWKDSKLIGDGDGCCYWTSTLHTYSNTGAWSASTSFTAGPGGWSYGDRCFGHPIRAVSE